MANVSETLLPDEVESLKAMVTHERAKRLSAEQELERLREQVRLLLAQRFAPKSERVVTEESPQLGLFNEAEAEAREDDEAAETTVVAGHTRRRGHRGPLPAHLPREDVLHELPEAERVCPHDGTALEVMGEETSEQLDLVPAVVRVLHHRRLKYTCPCCRGYVVTAPLPPQPVPKSQASAGLLASVAVAKYVDALPLYRQSEQLGRLGFEAPRQTLASWMVRCGALVQPLVNRKQWDGLLLTLT